MRIQRSASVVLLALSLACSGAESTGNNNDGNTPPVVTPTQLSKNSWQVDLASLRGSYRLQAPINQSGGTLSGSGRDNLREVDVVTTGSITGTTITVKFVLTNGSSPRGEFTCTANISGGTGTTQQTAIGTFVAPSASLLFGGATGSVGPASTECSMR